MAATTATTKRKPAAKRVTTSVTPISGEESPDYRPFNVKVLTVTGLPKVELRTYDLKKLDFKKLDLRSFDRSKLNVPKFDLPKLKTPSVQLPKPFDALAAKLRPGSSN